MNPEFLLNELSLLLRPPGQGIYAVSTGKKEQIEFTKKYIKDWLPNYSWKKHLSQLTDIGETASVALLAIPSDCGAGIVRGAAWGPDAIRKSLGSAPVFDLGDVFSVPHFIDDEMLSKAQIERTRKKIYLNVTTEQFDTLPVSPISMGKRVYQILKVLCPNLKILLLGGDHTVSCSSTSVLFEKGSSQNKNVGIVHFDAHTDLSSERLGVKYCFATWAYYANNLIGRGHRLVQIGIRASAQQKKYWESSCQVKQIWADEVLSLSPIELAERVVCALKARGVEKYYLTNDVDGTDLKWISACGTPEPNGLTPEHVLTTIHALKNSDLECIGADVVELAPGLAKDPEALKLSVDTTVRYVKAEIDLMRS